MGHVERRRLKSGGVSWRVRYTDPDGRERNKSFARKADAEAFETSISHSILAGSYVDPRAGRITVREYLEQWRVEQAHHRPATAASTRTRLKRMVYPFLGGMQVSQVRPSTVRNWQRQILAHEYAPGKRYAPSTIVGVRGVLAGAFKDAVVDRLIAASPFDSVKSIDAPREQIVPRTVAQVRAGQAAMPDRYRATITVVAGSGLRAGELFGLTVDRIDFLRATIRVDRQLRGRRGRDPVFGPPKTKASYRTVPIARPTVAALAAHLAAYPAAPGELVFRTARGGPVTRGVFGKAWAHARPALGLEPGEGLHQLRHFYASLLIAAGRSPIEVRDRLGHATTQETLDTYGHLWEGNEDGTRAAIEAAFAEPEPAAPEADAETAE